MHWDTATDDGGSDTMSRPADDTGPVG